MTPIAGMKNVAGTWCRSRRARIRGTDVVAPYSPTDKGTGRGFARCSNSLSTSKERQTATRAPLGQVLGVSFLPTLAVATACRICSSVESTVIGFTAAAGGWRDDCAGWALGELQPVSNPTRTSGTPYAHRLGEDSMLGSLIDSYGASLSQAADDVKDMWSAKASAERRRSGVGWRTFGLRIGGPE